jgi:hypothetical protein
MTDKQKEKLYKSILNWNEFLQKTKAQKDLSVDGVTIKFYANDHQVEIRFPEATHLISADEFDKLNAELLEQRTNDLRHEESRTNRISDMELNVIHELRKFVITKKYVTNLIYGSDIASAQRWYIKQLKEIVRLFGMGYRLYYDERVVETIKEFEQMFLSLHYNTDSIENTIKDYEEKHGIVWYEKP